MKIAIIFLIFLIVGCRYDGARNNIKSDKYKGTITDIYVVKHKHNMHALKINTNTYTFEEVADIWPGMWEYAEIGDSIIKPKDTLMIIIKKNDSISKEFFYEF